VDEEGRVGELAERLEVAQGLDAGLALERLEQQAAEVLQAVRVVGQRELTGTEK